jgi:hypothetical protein
LEFGAGADGAAAAAGEDEGAAGEGAAVEEGRRGAVRRELRRGAAAQRQGAAGAGVGGGRGRGRRRQAGRSCVWLRRQQACECAVTGRCMVTLCMFISHAVSTTFAFDRTLNLWSETRREPSQGSPERGVEDSPSDSVSILSAIGYCNC